ncbi:MFS transporter [Trichococcus shcherbakoviae]|uniref:MFS transporter n=1 Tax=Trichococcus shcherbakoviae TaxID=2094020 RepID=UPI0029F5A0CE|nr:MFS transporter [Trichococcus shcherbakoviae]
MEKTIENTTDIKGKIYLLTFISFLVGTLQFVIGGILDKVAFSVGVSVSTVGQVITAFSLAAAIGTPIFMMATAKMDRRKQLLIGLAAVLISTISTVALPGFGFLMVSRSLLGVGTGIYNISAYALVAKMAPPGRQAMALSNLAMGASAALVIGVPIARVMVAAFDWRIIFVVIGILTLLSILAVIRMIPAAAGEAPIPLSAQLALLKNPKIFMALSVSFLMFFAYSVVNSYTTPFLLAVMPSMESRISMILLFLGIASLIGSKLGGFLADRFGAAHTLVGGIIAQALALMLIPIFSGSVILIVSMLMIWSIAAWACGPTLNFNLVSIAPEASGIMLSLNSTFIQFGFAAGAAIGGIVVGSASIMAIMWTGAASLAGAVVVGLVSFGLMPPRKNYHL